MQELQNGITVPTNGDPYNLTQDLANAFGDANVNATIPSQAAQDALVKFTGMTIVRTDLAGMPGFTWNGSAWLRKDPVTWRFNRTIATDSNPGDIVGETSLQSGTITDAPAGLYFVDGRVCLYATDSIARGFVFVTAGGVKEEARNDFNGDSNPRSLTTSFIHAHGGGNLVVSVGYRQFAGNPIVTGQASGLSRVIATLIGN